MGIYVKQDGVLVPAATSIGLKGDQGDQGLQGIKGDPGGWVTAGAGTSDFNTMITPGTYVTGTVSNGPIAASIAYHAWVSRSGVNIVQTAFPRTGTAVPLGTLYVRTSSNDGATWTAWVRHLTTGDWNSPQLSTGQDANTILTAGRYFIATSGSNVNFPYTTRNAYLEVFTSGTINKLQTYTAVVNAEAWVRSSSDAGVTWSEWARTSAIHGTGSPDNVVTATVGAEYVDVAGTNGAIKWIKTTTFGASGWRVVYGDTGWRDVLSLVDSTRWNTTPSLTGCYANIRRVNQTVMVNVVTTRTGSTGVSNASANEATIFFLPTGFQAYKYAQKAQAMRNGQLASSAGSGPNALAVMGGQASPSTWTAGDSVSVNGTWLTSDNWPTTLPGTP